jgi:hypothetical protein
MRAVGFRSGKTAPAIRAARERFAGNYDKPLNAARSETVC